MTYDTLGAEYHTIARRLAERGYRVVIGYGKGGFWVRNPDMTKPPFADEHSFVSFARARKLCEKGPCAPQRQPRPRFVQPHQE